MRRDVSPDLKRAMKQLRLGRLLPSLPDRLQIARERTMDPEDLLLTLFTSEIERRCQERHARRAAEAGLDAALVFDAWDRTAKVTYDVALMDALRTLRFVERHQHVLIMGPVGVGKTMVTHALGHLAIARDLSVHCEPAVKLLHRLRASRLDGTHASEMRRLCTVDVLLVDDLALAPMTPEEAGDLFDIVSARHQTASMVVSSNREPSEWLALLPEPIQAQALVDRFSNNAFDLVIEGESYRARQKPRLQA